jgi:hypothetical protein
VPATLPSWGGGATSPDGAATAAASGFTKTITLAVLPWHLQVTGADFPAVVSDGRLSALLETAVAVDIASLLGLASPDWVTVQLLSSIAAPRRATTAALAADVMVQVPEGDRDASAATMVLRATADVLDSWLNETRIVYNSLTAARNAEVNQADSAANTLGTTSTDLCSMTCIIIICVCVVIVIGIVSATVVVWVEAKKKRQRMKDALRDSEMYDASDMGADDFEAVNAASPDRLNPFGRAQSEDGRSDDTGGSASHGEAEDDDDASYDAAEDALEADELEEDESVALAPQLSSLRRGSQSSRAFSPSSPGVLSSRKSSAAFSPSAAAAVAGRVRRPSGGSPMSPGGRQRLSTSARFSVASLGGHSSHGDVTIDDVV